MRTTKEMIKDMKTYIKPTLKVLKIDAEEMMDDGFIHFSVGDGNQLSKQTTIEDEEEKEEEGLVYSLPHIEVNVWDEE